MGHHKRRNTKLDFANEDRIKRKKMEQEAGCLGRKADSFCLKGLMDREVNGFKSTKHNWNLQNMNGVKSKKHYDLLIKAKNNAWNKMNTENYALRCEESAIKFEANATESENKLNEFRKKR